jgi:hypothetical protein
MSQEWLRDNAPQPMKGQNYHQWLSGPYGLKRLIEHIWKVIGIANTCRDIDELSYKMLRYLTERDSIISFGWSP